MSRKLLLCVCLLALACGGALARCPEGLRPLDTADDDMIGFAQSVGNQGWSKTARAWCADFPEVINAAGMDYYETVVTPYCADPAKGLFHFTVETNNPCDENKKFVGYFDIRTDPPCDQTWVRTDQFTPAVTAAPAGESEGLEALTCPEGYRAATAEELEGRVAELLWQTVTSPLFSNQTAGQIDDAWYCDDALGFKWANATATGGCMSEEEAATPAGADSAASLSMMAQGSVTWVCAQQARRRSVDLMVDTQYVMACQYGTTPDGQLIPPSMGDAPEQPSK